MAFITLNGHDTWVQLPKRKKNVVVLLHGGLSSSNGMLKGIGRRLPRRYSVAAFDRIGHGQTADNGSPFHYESMADEVIGFLEVLGVPSDVVGYSDGGNVALLVALRRPELIKRLVLVGANYHFSGLVPGGTGESRQEMCERFVAKYCESHPGEEATARSIFERTMKMFDEEPTLTSDRLATINVPVLVVSGDDDLVQLSHTVSLYESLPEAQLLVVPGASHSVLSEQPGFMAEAIVKFLEGPVVPSTFIPVRRRQVESD